MFSATNVALHKRASQYEQNPSKDGTWPAGLAVNGKKECNSVTRSTVTLSGYSKYPWWQVDLGAIYDVNEINVYGRGDGVAPSTCTTKSKIL